MVDIKSVLEDAENPSQLIIGGVRLPNGVELTNIRIDTAKDERQFQALVVAFTPSNIGAAAPVGYAKA